MPARCIQNLPIVLISTNLLGKLRTNSKWTHQVYFILISGHIEDIFKKSLEVLEPPQAG